MHLCTTHSFQFNNYRKLIKVKKSQCSSSVSSKKVTFYIVTLYPSSMFIVPTDAITGRIFVLHYVTISRIINILHFYLPGSNKDRSKIKDSTDQKEPQRMTYESHQTNWDSILLYIFCHYLSVWMYNPPFCN